MSSYDHLSKEQLLALLQRREREASYGLVWERDEIEPLDITRERGIS